MKSPASVQLTKGGVSRSVRLAYALGGVNGMFGNWFYASLARPVFNMALGLSPTLVGVVLMVSRLSEGLLDVVFGWLSDNTRTRWGRRRPYILAGSVLGGLALPCLFLVSPGWDPSMPWQTNRLFWYMLISALLYAVLVGLYSMPYASLGNELTPDYNERTDIMAVRAVFQKIAGVGIAAAWWIARTFHVNPVTGQADVLGGARFAACVAGAIMILSGLVCFTRTRERYYEKVREQKRTGFWSSSREVLASPSFRVLFLIVVLFVMGTTIGNDLGQYVGVYHVFGGDQTAMARYSFWAAIGQFSLGVCGVWLTTRLARRFGKRRAFAAALLTGMAAYGSSWWMYKPGNVGLLVLNLSLTVISSSALWVLTPSMCGDVVDDDELRSGLRREGSYNSWMSWLIKAGLALSMVASGAILEVTGFDALQGAHQPAEVLFRIRLVFMLLPMVALGLGVALLWFYPLSHTRVVALRRELEARRGAV